MNVIRMRELLQFTTQIVSKGDVTQQCLKLLGVPSVLTEGIPDQQDWEKFVIANKDEDDAELVDCHLLTVAVNKRRAARVLNKFIDLLEASKQAPLLADGPSYMQVAAVLGNPLAALRFFALGHALGLWSVLTPADLGLDAEHQDTAALLGMVNITGYPRSVFDEQVLVAQG